MYYLFKAQERSLTKVISLGPLIFHHKSFTVFIILGIEEGANGLAYFFCLNF